MSPRWHTWNHLVVVLQQPVWRNPVVHPKALWWGRHPGQPAMRRQAQTVYAFAQKLYMLAFLFFYPSSFFSLCVGPRYEKHWGFPQLWCTCGCCKGFTMGTKAFLKWPVVDGYLASYRSPVLPHRILWMWTEHWHQHHYLSLPQFQPKINDANWSMEIN